VAASDLRKGPSWGQSGRDGDAQQVEHVRQLGLHRPAAPAGAPSEPEVGREEGGARRRDQQREPGTAGRRREHDQRACQTGERSTGLDGRDVVDRRVEPGGRDALAEAA
jgi:hypothetical protein